MTSFCPKCGEKIIKEEFLFCPKCGERFQSIEEKTIMKTKETTEDGGTIIMIDKESFSRDVADTPPEERYTPEFYQKKIKDRDSPYYIPPNAVRYETDDGAVVVTHEQVDSVKPVVIPHPYEQEKGFIPEGAVVEVQGDENFRIETHHAAGVVKVEEVKLIDSPDELLGATEEIVKETPTTRPKMKDIAAMIHLNSEERAELMKIHKYSKTAITRWLKQQKS